MNKLIHKIKNTFSYLGVLKKELPVTFWVLLAGTACFFLRMLFDEPLNIGVIHAHLNMLDIILGHLGLWMVFLLFAVFLTEVILPEGKEKLGIPLTAVESIITFFYSGLCAGTWVQKEAFARMAEVVGNDRLDMFTIGYFIILALLILYYCYKKAAAEFSFSEYLMGVISGEFLILVAYTVVMLGILALTLIYIELLSGEFEDFFFPIWILVSGIYGVGGSVLVIAKSQKDIPKFIHILFCYVLFIMSLAAYVIIYAYMIKIIVLHQIPSNSVFSILTALFVCSMPLAYLNSASEEGWIGKVSRVLPVIFVPLLILQAYSVFIRVGQYGLTPSRYLGMVYVVFEAVFILWYMLKRDLMHHILPVLAAIVFLMTFMPGANALDMPKFSQHHTLKKLMAGDIDSLNEKEKKRLLAAYDYLKQTDDGMDELEKEYGLSKLEILSEAREEEGYYDDTSQYVSYECDAAELDVKGYTSIQTFEGYAYEDDMDLKHLEINIKRIGSAYAVAEEEASLTFDASELVDFLKDPSYEREQEMYEKKPLLYDRGDHRFVITSASMAYDRLSGEITSISVDGYLLKK